IVNAQEAGLASRAWKLIAGENEWLTADKLQISQASHFMNFQPAMNAKGIYAYKHPLLCKKNDDDKVVVVFLDTNGFCDNEFHLDKTIFVLMSLICSHHIINVQTHCDDTEFAILSVSAKLGNTAYSHDRIE
ncbi:uncharacterized protein TRIADDRAFT_62616, partial [Trichoplax adhaerens]